MVVTTENSDNSDGRNYEDAISFASGGGVSIT